MNEQEKSLVGIWLQKITDSKVKFQPLLIPVYEVVVMKHEITGELIMVPRLRQDEEKGPFAGDMLFINPELSQEYLFCFCSATHWCKQIINLTDIEGENNWNDYQQASWFNYMNVLLTMTNVMYDEIPFYIDSDLDEGIYQEVLSNVVSYLIEVTSEYNVNDVQAQKYIVTLLLNQLFSYHGLQLPQECINQAFEDVEITNDTLTTISESIDFWEEALNDIQIGG